MTECLNQDFKVKDENWGYCELCDCISYHFDCCGNSLCNGGGCDVCCPDHHKLIEEMIMFGKHPPIGEMKRWEDNIDKILGLVAQRKSTRLSI